MTTILNPNRVAAEEVAAARRSGTGTLRILRMRSIIARWKGEQRDMLPIERALEIEAKAWGALARIKITSDSDLPVAPADLADDLGIIVREVSFKESDISGAISRKDGGVVILVNKFDPPNRRRFTIAHELGHFYLHLGEDQEGEATDRVDFRRTLYGGRAHTMEEQEANHFAAAFLMPCPLIGQALRGADNTQDMSASFGVSEEAMSIRLKTIEKHPELLYAVQR